MADRLVGGGLAAILTERRATRKQSLDQIARELYAEHGIEVTRQTLAVWIDALETEAQPETAA
jgi:hypothetical protein